MILSNVHCLPTLRASFNRHKCLKMRRSDRNKPKYDDSFSPSDADWRHHGLINQGATCYLNSVLQVLFMTKDFREAVKRDSSNKSPRSIDPDLKDLFQDLEKNTANTNRITKKLGVEMVHEQRDAAEFFEKILEMLDSQAKQIFRGLLAHFVCCNKCDKESVQDQQFWYLPLSLGDNSRQVSRVEDGIEEFLKTSTFTGENQIYCDNCKAKTDCTEKTEVTRHPDVLTLLLKRFHFNRNTKSYTKKNLKVVIPFTLDKPKRYQLYAVIEHSGELRNGHYVALIQTDEDRWFCFNDDKVSRVQQSFKYGPIKSSKAYLLFYRLKTMNDTDMKNEDIQHSAALYPTVSHSNKHLNSDTEKRRGKVCVKGKDDAKHTPEDVKPAEQERELRGQEEDKEEEKMEVDDSKPLLMKTKEDKKSAKSRRVTIV